MSKRVYISADYAEYSGDRNVVDVLKTWGSDNYHKTDFVDTAAVVSVSVSKAPDCRACDLKDEFNRQINASSAVIIVIGDKTKYRTAGSRCERKLKARLECNCTPYKQNSNGMKECKIFSTYNLGRDSDCIGNINSYSCIEHEFRQAVWANKEIIIVYDSLVHEPGWLPSYMSGYKELAEPFWTRDTLGRRVGNYAFIKRALGYV